MIYKIFWIIRALVYKICFGKIGNLCYIGKPLFLKGVNKIEIGDRVRIFPGLRAETYDKGSINIKRNVAIGQNFHITSSSEEIIIGENTTILGNVFVTNIDHEYQEINRHILDQPFAIRTTNIGANCFIGYGAAIQAGTVLGKQCIVGTNSVLRGTYPEYSVIVGAPAIIVKRYNFKSMKWEKTNEKGEFREND